LALTLQILSDLHLETESHTPQHAPGADLLVLAGDIDTRWQALSAFAGWPVPVVFVPGNHEYDGRDVDEAQTQLRERCASLGIRMLSCDAWVWAAPDGRRIRFVGATRWCDFDLQGEAFRAKATRAAGYYLRHMNASRHGQPLNATAMRELALAELAWLTQTLHDTSTPANPWDTTVVVTHFAPSARSADPRYGVQPSTASFCNADDALLPLASLWIHGHLHWRADYQVPHPNGPSRVVCNPRGHSKKGEPDGFNGVFTVSI
jgi:Calcineurin-like phosphoesterase